MLLDYDVAKFWLRYMLFLSELCILQFFGNCSDSEALLSIELTLHWVNAYAQTGNNQNNLLLKGYCQICLNVKCMFGPLCLWDFNGFDSKETGVYYCFSQSYRTCMLIHVNNITAWNTKSVSQAKWFYCSM